MKKFLENFFRENKARILGFSFLRILSYIQVLFWPFALAKILDLMTSTPINWHEAGLWVCLMIFNKVLEDIVRLRSKLGLETIINDLKIKLTIFFTEKTEISKGTKTGEALQAIKNAIDTAESLLFFYKESFFQLPVNLILIPMILLRASVDYFLILVFFVTLYLAIEYLIVRFFSKKLADYLRAAEVFWGTTYRKAPEVWREREENEIFSKDIRRQGKKLGEVTDSFYDISNWRWIALQVASSLSIGLSLGFVVYKIVNKTAPVGDLVLVIGYLAQIQESLNIVTNAISQVVQAKISLERLRRAIRIHD